jgi:methyl-accepting chemotaxis protein
MLARNVARASHTLARIRPGQFALVAALLVALAARALPDTALATTDAWLGRPGDTAMLLVIGLMLLSAARFGVKDQSKAAAPAEAQTHPPSGPQALARAMLETHLQLDQAMDGKLQEVVTDTEDSATNIIGQVRQLYDSANTVVVYLESSSLQANSMGKDIVESVGHLMEIGQFIEELPQKMERDLTGIQIVMKEIKELSELVGAVQAISMQSHLLAINAAIEGSHAGPSGAAFRIVAQEMRKLASNSSGVADRIKAGLKRARDVVEGGMTQSIEESSRHLERVSNAAVSIHKLQDNFEDMSQYFKMRFAVVTKHNEELAVKISDVLGHIQYQDVVSQCIGRLRVASAQRNEFLQSALTQLEQGQGDLTHLSQEFDLIWQGYVSEEEKHRHSARHGQEGVTELKFELF